MASFAEGVEEFTGLLPPIQRLGTDEEFDCPRKHGDELVTCALAPDGKWFAWSLGTRMVFVVQTQSDKAGCSFDELKKRKIGEKAEWNKKCLDCTVGVTALEFGCRSSDIKWHSDQVHYKIVHNFPKGKIVLAAGLSNGEIKLWDLECGRIILLLQDHKAAITGLSFSPDGSLVLASASKDSSVKLWDLTDDGNMFKTLHCEHSKQVNAIAWSPVGQRIASVGVLKMALLWNARTGTLERRLENGHLNDVTGCCFSPDGALLFTSSWDTTVICWDVQTGAKRTVYGHMFPPPRPIFAGGVNGHEVRGVTVCPDGMHIASVCRDGYIRVWNIFHGTNPIQKAALRDARAVHFSHNGFLLAVGCQSGEMNFFAAPMQTATLQHRCRLTVRQCIISGDGCAALRALVPRKAAQYLNYADIVT
ncbi:WD repeat and SOCS box-containing protein 1-like [Paramacrobiotus metropolitanus]|uniref:WD repeat and SOCS box-containing protein 1-like n=1 Tax=Paramacrobiotus metropolitanus TaxID=2943436 RepID=UPI002445E3DC|nr:WD repeat and SOCS box-containing protein 1-like [Paramacrobiotus metropolitanus]XP_055327797.1 WD repeat and SOCS box-containing protein 1-like [Paramacrobiotus metropolitanus]